MKSVDLNQEWETTPDVGKGRVTWESVQAAHTKIVQGAPEITKSAEGIEATAYSGEGAEAQEDGIDRGRESQGVQVVASGQGIASIGVAEKEGEGGEPGGQNLPGATDTAFTTIATFGAQPLVDSGGTSTANAVEAPVQSSGTVVDPQQDDDVLTHKANENPVVTEAKARGLYKTPLGSGMHEIKCPWGHEHTNSAENSATYTEPDEYQTSGSFRCKDASHTHITAKDLMEELGVPKMVARNKPTIRNVAGDLHSVVDASEKVLASRSKFFQSGTVIVSVTTDPTTGNPAISPTSMLTLTRELSAAASWEKEDSRSGGWKPCDPPARHVSILYNASEYRYLPPLAGVARQPYIDEADGALVIEPGYNEKTQIFGVFDPAQFQLAEPTMEAALQALAKLTNLLSEFHFTSDHDTSAMVSAIITAVVRPSLAHAPAYHLRAHDIGSGKSYACELISAFASPAPSEKVSYPTTSEEATKVILSLLLKNPAVIEFDDMDSDWIAHGAFKRMLTAEFVTDRVLGHSKTATVRTRVLFLGSGNNVGPKDDMRRRVATINLDPKCATPTTMEYKGSPVEAVRKNRGAYVAAVLTIVQAWIKAGKPRAQVKSIATYGAWSDYCRQSLLWLGLADPATSLLDQVTHDPDGDPLVDLLHAWKGAFGTTATTVRKALQMAAGGQRELDEAIRDCLGEERGQPNPSKMGWFLKKHAGRIVKGMRFVDATADGRKAWKIVVVDQGVVTESLSTRVASIDDESGMY